MTADLAACTRGDVLKAAMGVAGLAVCAPFARLAAQSSTPARLADDLFIITIPGEANVVAHTSAEGVLLVDGASPAASDALMHVLASLPGDRRVHTLINTHWHPEQTGSNERLGKAGTPIIAHENTRLWTTTDVTW